MDKNQNWTSRQPYVSEVNTDGTRKFYFTHNEEYLHFLNKKLEICVDDHFS